MKEILVGNKVKGTQIVFGCMRIGKKSEKDAIYQVETAKELGINYFDNADIYCDGKSEELFGKAIKNFDRSKIVVQSKCGIRKGYYDFSKEHIISSVEGSLKRIGTDYLDVLCLHRPDALMEGEEVLAAFDDLKSRGLVKNFGVSNFNPMQVEYLKKYVSEPLICNQLQFGVLHTGMIDNGICANMKCSGSFDHDGYVLEYSRINDMTIQAWGPLRHFDKEKGILIDHPELEETNQKLKFWADKYGVSKSAICIAWILRHPANIQPILGTTSPERLAEMAKADNVELTREDWYSIYKDMGNIIP